jgi:hypothetical protein
LVSTRIDRQDVALHSGFAYTPRKQVTVLAARIENCDAVHGSL